MIALILLALPATLSFTSPSVPRSPPTSICATHEHAGRRPFLRSAALLPFLAPRPSSAGIDVSGLRQDGGSAASSAPSDLANQLRSIDGSASARIRAAKEAEIASKPAEPLVPLSGSLPPRSTMPDTGSAAIFAQKSGPGGLSKIGFGQNNQYDGYVEAPPGYRTKQIRLSFAFPSDWLALDRLSGGIQYVDQRNGDKLYVLRAPLPEGKSLEEAPKSFFAESVFDVRGDIVRSGTVVDSARSSRSQMVAGCAGGTACAARRRLTFKYDTVTGNGVQTVERRGLCDAYEVGGYAYMMLASSNAVLFEKKGRERETTESIVESFTMDI